MPDISAEHFCENDDYKKQIKPPFICLIGISMPR